MRFFFFAPTDLGSLTDKLDFDLAVCQSLLIGFT
jgi:hypothetical protein